MTCRPGGNQLVRLNEAVRDLEKPRERKQKILRLAFWKKMEGSVSGLAMGFFRNSVEGNTKGVSLAVLENRAESTTGVAVGIGNEIDRFKGISLAGCSNAVSSATGFCLAGCWNDIEAAKGMIIAGVINTINGPVEGVAMASFANLMTQGASLNGVGVSLVNRCGELNGMTVGVLNVAQAPSSGVQIGLLNIKRYEKKWYRRYRPIISIHFLTRTLLRAIDENHSEEFSLLGKRSRVELVRQYATQNHLLPEHANGGPYRETELERFLQGISIDTTTLLKFAKSVASKKHMRELGATLRKAEAYEARKDAARQLSMIAAGSEIYPKRTRLRALSELLTAQKRRSCREEAEKALQSLGINKREKQGNVD